MGRKRDRTHFSRHAPYSFPTRRRPPPPTTDEPLTENSSSTTKQPATVVVIGVPSDCSVLDLKSRFEIYGSISRTRMDPNGLAYVTFRSIDSAQAAITAAADSSFPITLQSEPVQVIWESDHGAQWKEGVMRKDEISMAASRLVRAEVPLIRGGRGNSLGSAIVNPRNENNDNGSDNVRRPISTRLGEPNKGREIVAYDDIL